MCNFQGERIRLISTAVRMTSSGKRGGRGWKHGFGGHREEDRVTGGMQGRGAGEGEE